MVHGSENHSSTPSAGASPSSLTQGNPNSQQPIWSKPKNVPSRTVHTAPCGGIRWPSLPGLTPASLNATPEAGPHGGYARRSSRDSSHTSSSRPLLLQVVPVARRTPQHRGLEVPPQGRSSGRPAAGLRSARGPPPSRRTPNVVTAPWLNGRAAGGVQARFSMASQTEASQTDAIQTLWAAGDRSPWTGEAFGPRCRGRCWRAAGGCRRRPSLNGAQRRGHAEPEKFTCCDSNGQD